MNKVENILPKDGSCLKVSESGPSKVENLRQNLSELTKEDLPEFFSIDE